MPCFVPPILLKNMALSGDAELREWALQQLAEDVAERNERNLLDASSKRTSIDRHSRMRTVFDAQHLRTLPGKAVRSEQQEAVEDVAVNEAFDGAGITWDFFEHTFKRRSIDGHGMPLRSSVHYGRRYANAFWNGEQMVYGDGDGKIFGRFSAAVDVIAHELGHGITEFEAGLAYEGESGSLNEHFSDVFGILVKQWSLSLSSAQSDWLIGTGIFTSRVTAKAIRSMRAPGSAYDDPLLGKDEQPAHMRHYVETKDDNGGVHLNCGIPSKAFYELSISLGGNAWEAPGHIWYSTLCNQLRPTSGFQECADGTYRAAGELYGRNSREQKAVRAAWKKVGLTAGVRAAKTIAPVDSPRLTPLFAAGEKPSVSIAEEAGVRAESFRDRKLT